MNLDGVLYELMDRKFFILFFFENRSDSYDEIEREFVLNNGGNLWRNILMEKMGSKNEFVSKFCILVLVYLFFIW